MLGRTVGKAWAADCSCDTGLIVSAVVASNLDHACLVEVTAEVEVVFGPDTLQGSYELITSSADDLVHVSRRHKQDYIPISLTMVKPPLTDGRELALEPSRHHVYRDTPASVSCNISVFSIANLPLSVLIDTGDLLCCNSRIPRARQQSRNHVQSLREMQHCL